jgi:polysaccharide pyruvyl transferase WcaK-like protein
MTRPVLLSNYRTVNLGNQALTAELQAVFAELTGGPVHGVHRLPSVFEARLLRLHERGLWSRELQAVLTAGIREPAGDVNTRTEAIDPAPIEHGVAGRSWLGTRNTRRRQAARHLRRLPGARELFEHQARANVARRAALLEHADEVIYVPAGEINPFGFPIGRFFELALAQAAEVPVALVNFSVERPPTVIGELSQQLFPAVERFAVRDERSGELVVDLGGRADRVAVVPDAVILTSELSDKERLRASKRWQPLAGATGIVANGLHGSSDAEGWCELVQELQHLGHRPVFLSSEAALDKAWFRAMRARLGSDVAIAPEISDRREFLGLLGQLRGVVTARLHTAVLAAVAGAPTVALEAGSHKVGGALATIGLGHRCIRIGPEGWPTSAIQALTEATAPRSDEIERVRHRVRAAYREMFPMASTPFVATGSSAGRAVDARDL